MANETKEKKEFIYNSVTNEDINHEYKFDLTHLYKQAHSELTLQQTKRDQIITLYLSIFSLLVPFAFSLEVLTDLYRGLIFIALGIIGIIFAVITIRYRIYKELYWLCCETLTCMMNIKNEKLNKNSVQSLFYRSLAKKGNNYFKNGKWSSYLYFKKNLFSSETLYYLIIVLLTSAFVGLGLFLIFTPYSIQLALIISVPVIVVLLTALMATYFHHCTDVYAVLKDNLDSSFNRTFGKAWFLHMYIDLSDDKKIKLNRDTDED